MKKWIQAFRLRTLPLAIASILMGSALSYAENCGHLEVMLLSILTTLFLQILSNLANDYGDFEKGTDNDDRIGPERSLQSGKISKKQMGYAIALFAILALVSGLSLIFEALQDYFIQAVVFLIIGLAAIAAAMKYTMGKKAYGYSGLGDLFVYLFFGIVAVGGTFYLSCMQFKLEILLPASTMGLLSAGVLNLNNLRDHKNDALSSKNTLVVKVGFERAKAYHLFLLTSAMLMFLTYILFYNWNVFYLLPLITLPLFIRNGAFVWKCKDESKLDPELKKLALSTSLFSLLFALAVYSQL